MGVPGSEPAFERGHRVRVVEQPTGLGQLREQGIERGPQRRRVAAAHRRGQRRAGGGDPGAVPERAGTERQRQRPGSALGGGGGQRGGDHVRSVADPGHGGVVVVGRRRHRTGTEPGHQRGEAEPVVQGGLGFQAEHPRTAVEQRRITGRESGRLPPGHRMPAQPARARAVLRRELPGRTLDRGHVGEQAGVTSGVQLVEHRPGGGQRHREHHQLRAGHGGRHRIGQPGGGAGGGVGVVPGDPGPEVGEPAEQRSSDQAEAEYRDMGGRGDRHLTSQSVEHVQHTRYGPS